MRENKMQPPFGMGVATILTVLLILSLSIFATLSLSSARADYALSKINADTVSAYYKADAQAAELYRTFRAGTEQTLETTLPMTEGQSLYLHLRRFPDGKVETLAWRTVPTDAGEQNEEDNVLKVWTGEE